MNLSGEAVSHYLRRVAPIPPRQVLVVVDDASLALGVVRLKMKGSSGGHNGLKDIQRVLGTSEYPRMRLGIGAPPVGVDLADYVLAPFLPEEEENVCGLVERGVVLLQQILHQPLDQVVQKTNQGLKTPSEKRVGE